MADVYTSKHTGAQIDTAVDAFLAGGYSVYATVDCKTSNWKSPTSGVTGPGKYYCQITLQNVLGSVYPQVFAVMSEKTYYASGMTELGDGLVVVSPYVVFSASSSASTINVCLWSNVQIEGTIIFIGSSNSNNNATATINN